MITVIIYLFKRTVEIIKDFLDRQILKQILYQIANILF
jgi:hypothetical protein